MKMATNISFLLLIIVSVVPAAVFAELRQGFYAQTCPRAEQIVQTVVQTHIQSDPFVTAGLLRLHFHDCFVSGCDASLLIDSTAAVKSEKDTGPNFTVRGYEVIDDIKTTLETECPGIVSCADIVTLATRDSVALAGGPKFDIPTGRRDGMTSSPESVNLPGPTASVDEASVLFLEKGFTLEDMVVLLGAHTVGISHCIFFNARVTGEPDPDMDPAMAADLKKTCQSSTVDKPTAFLDQNTSMLFDNEYFNQLLQKKGLLQVDQNLELDPATNPFVTALAKDPAAFAQKFADTFVRLSATEVLIDDQGEVRKNCRTFNNPIAAAAADSAAEEAKGAAPVGNRRLL